MKKYISFQLIILMSVCNTSYVYSMEKESAQENVCYLAFLPAELWNYIAQFLCWETEKEFIARTKIEKDDEFPEKYYIYFGCEDKLGIEHILGVFSPDKNKIALFEKCGEGCIAHDVCDSCVAPLLVIVDLKVEKEEDKTLFAGSLDKRCYRTIGLAPSGNMYATIKKEIKNKSVVMASYRDYQDVLMIYDMINDKECNFEIPNSFYVSHLMFNKQGTCVIAYARDFRCEPMQKNYLLFDLKNVDKERNDADEKAVVENKDEKKRLLDYFRSNRVCKEIKGIDL